MLGWTAVKKRGKRQEAEVGQQSGPRSTKCGREKVERQETSDGWSIVLAVVVRVRVHCMYVLYCTAPKCPSPSTQNNVPLGKHGAHGPHQPKTDVR